MLIDFFLDLKAKQIPVTITEFLAFLEALESGLANCQIEQFYSLARICLIKNESYYDRFNTVFSAYIEKIKNSNILEEIQEVAQNIHQNPKKRTSLSLDKQKETIAFESVEDDEKPTEQNPFAIMGKGQAPIERLDDNQSSLQQTVRAWNSRDFKALDSEVELDIRNIKMALRRLREFAREGVPDELDLEETIRKTAHNAGWLDLVMRPERKNKVKVLLLFDSGGSMTPHIKCCQELFSAARSEFKHMEHFYFHNCVYDTVWKYDTPTNLSHYSIRYITNKYANDYKLILVGDATMGLSELKSPGSLYYHSESQISGEDWLRILVMHFKHSVWLNPEQEKYWPLTASIGAIQSIMENRMYPLTLRGLDDAMRRLNQ